MHVSALPVPVQAEAELPQEVDDRRGASRIRAVLFTARIVREGDAGLFRVQNISDTGLLLITHVNFAVGEAVTISLLDDLTITGKIVWVDDHRCGIRFDRAIDSSAVLSSAADQTDDRRGRAMRVPAERLATSYAENGIRAVRITDVSRGGVGFKHDGTFRPGMFVKFVLEGGSERSGIVRWSSDRHGGVYLIEPWNGRELQSVRNL